MISEGSVRDFLHGVSVPRGYADDDRAFLFHDALAGQPAVALQAGVPDQGAEHGLVANERDRVERGILVERELDRGDDGAFVRNRGLLALPEPRTGDLFFDIEGARYYSEDGREFGLQYLFGIVDTADLDAVGTFTVDRESLLVGWKRNAPASR